MTNGQTRLAILQSDFVDAVNDYVADDDVTDDEGSMIEA